MGTMKLEDYFKQGKRRMIAPPKETTGLNEGGMIGDADYKPSEPEDLAKRVQEALGITPEAEPEIIEEEQEASPVIPEKKRALEPDELAAKVAEINAKK